MKDLQQCIIDYLNTHYGLSVTALTFLPIGADLNASCYKAETSGPAYFVKLKQGRSDDISVVILAWLQESGIEQILPPIMTIHGELIQYIDDFTLIVYPFVEGRNGFCFDLTNDHWMILGKVLRQIHDFDVPSALKNRIRTETYVPKLPSFTEASFMKEHRGIINRLVDRAEFYRQKVQEQSPKFVLCHSDIHGGNVLIDNKDALYIVDWDEPVLAPKERDLMFIGAGVANVWNNPHEEECFYRGYVKTEINWVILTYYRMSRIVVDIAEYARAIPSEGENRWQMLKQYEDMFAPNGVVDIAFQTDERTMGRHL